MPRRDGHEGTNSVALRGDLGKETCYIADCSNSSVRKVRPDGAIVTIAGTGKEGYSGNGGPATEAELADPHGISVGKKGCLYIAEPRNHCIRKVWL